MPALGTALIIVYGLAAIAFSIWAGVALNRKVDLSRLSIGGFAGGWLRASIRGFVFMVAFIAVSETAMLPLRILNVVGSR